MKISYVNELPKITSKSMYKMGKLQKLIFDFAERDEKIMKVEIGENDYKNAYVARSTFDNAIRKTKLNIKVHKRGNTLYLEKVEVE